MEEVINCKSAYYTFDIRVLKDRIEYLRKVLPKDTKICYAIKANSFIVREIDNYIDKYELCSPGEVRICDALGIESNKTVISGVYKTPEIIESYIQASNNRTYTVESMNQFVLLDDLSKKYEKKLRILLRLTNDSQFGINEEEIENIISDREEYRYLDIAGIQYFTGTQKNSLKKISREINKVDDLLDKLKDKYGYKAREFEYGSGFYVPYFECDDYDEDSFIQEFTNIINNMRNKCDFTLELGRSIAACCGKYYTHIVDIKRNCSINYALVDGGMHHMTYYGQSMAMKKPFMHVCNKNNIELVEYNICGSLCSMNDIIVKQVKMPELEIGDTICFDNVGAYCMTECLSLFLTRDIPAVYLLQENGKIECVRDSKEVFDLNCPIY